MEEYTFLRQLADSWGLLVLFLFFVGIVVWVFRPGSTASYRDTANIPFRHADAPAAANTDPAVKKEART
ncbi:MAG: cbb3-type cytochrome c oxidase subunit 3 [Marinibacterium sp.]|nr:cbb3-type cytochrome c oxidase subunit 3 [Marinibacterium sp.]